MNHLVVRTSSETYKAEVKTPDILKFSLFVFVVETLGKEN